MAGASDALGAMASAGASGAADSGGSSKWKERAKAAGSSLQKAGASQMEDAREDIRSGNLNRQQPLNLPNYRKGGKVKKTGPARLHKGEVVVPRGKVKKVKKAVRQMKKRKSGREL